MLTNWEFRKRGKVDQNRAKLLRLAGESMLALCEVLQRRGLKNT